MLAATQEYLPTLALCFQAEGHRLQGVREESIELRWMIDHAGRVARFETAPALDPGAPLQACLAQAFAVWRYPRNTGENQHVTQTFHVSASPRVP